MIAVATCGARRHASSVFSTEGARLLSSAKSTHHLTQGRTVQTTMRTMGGPSLALLLLLPLLSAAEGAGSAAVRLPNGTPCPCCKGWRCWRSTADAAAVLSSSVAWLSLRFWSALGRLLPPVWSWDTHTHSYTYAYTYTHTHTHTHPLFLSLSFSFSPSVSPEFDFVLLLLTSLFSPHPFCPALQAEHAKEPAANVLEELLTPSVYASSVPIAAGMRLDRAPPLPPTASLHQPLHSHAPWQTKA